MEKVISTFSTTPVTVKRKYKSYNPPGSTTSKSQHWWFVVRAEESVLVQLEKDWVSIQVQTGWQLTPLLHFVAVSDQSDVITVDNAVDNLQSASHIDKQSSKARQPEVFEDKGDQLSTNEDVSSDTSDNLVEQDLDCGSVDTNLSTPVCRVSSPSKRNSEADHVPCSPPHTQTSFLES